MKTGVFIGRCQPLHAGHIAVISKMIDETDQQVILLGSANQSRNLRNPYTYQERRDMILRKFPDLTIFPLNDYLYDDNLWKVEVNEILYKFNDVRIYGHTKPDNEYLKWFPTHRYVEVYTDLDVTATDIRNSLLECGLLHPNVQDEYNFFKKEKETFANYPFPETLQFNCADSLIYNDGKILLIKRRFAPGKDTWALPGGFKNHDETFFECAKRELFEEAGIQIKEKDQNESIDYTIFNNIFDSPKRKFGGLMRVTNCFLFQVLVPEIYEPEIRAADDASEVQWFDISHAVNNLNLFHDHRDIIITMTAEFLKPAYLNDRYK